MITGLKSELEGSKKESTKQETKEEVEESELIQFKIVFWGPGESGKTTNYKFLRKNFRHFDFISHSMSVETTDGRTSWADSCYFSFMVNMPHNKEYKVIVQLVTCTGQERFLGTREYVLDGADGIIFVGDSGPDKMEQNKRSYRELIAFSKSKNIPNVIQLNKRDLKDAVSLKHFKEEMELPMEKTYSDGTEVVYPAIATEGENVLESFRAVIFLAIFDYFFY